MKILNPIRTNDLEQVSYIVVTHVVHFTFTSLRREFYIQLLETGGISGFLLLLLLDCGVTENGLQHRGSGGKH
jgi:hypothetical protein